MPDPNNPMGRQIQGGALTPVYIAGSEPSSGLQDASLLTTPRIYNILLVVANTEYQLVLPYTCYRVFAQSRGTNAFRFSYVPGHVAAPTEPYLSIAAGQVYDSGMVTLTGHSIYVAGVLNDVIEVEIWA